LRKLGVLAALLCFVATGFQTPPQSKKPTTKHKSSTASKKVPARTRKPTTSSAKKRVTTKRPAVSSAKKPVPTKKSTKTAKKSRSRKRAPSWRTSQQVPTSDRYHQIQQVLIDKGYLGGPATGAWGPESVAALKKFQGDQNLEPSGKLDSLSLIALGLGPRRELRASSSGVGSVTAPASSNGSSLASPTNETPPTNPPNRP